MTAPQVDVVITTVGRPTLAQAILAAAGQTYQPTRPVVLADGPNDRARHVSDQITTFAGSIIYRETPEAAGHGNPVKASWIQNPQASPFIRFLDDDDWMPPESVELMMRAMAPGVSLVVGKYVNVVPALRGASGHFMLRGGKCAAHHATTGTMLMRTAAAREAAKLTDELDDWSRAQALAQVGRVVCVDAVVYWAPRGRGVANWRWDIERRRAILEAEIPACADPRKRARLERALANVQLQLEEAECA